MIRMFVRHRLADFGAWKKVYDGFDAKRRTMGVTGHAVFQAAGDANDVTGWHDFESIDAARRFAESDELRSAMTSAGVAGKPDIWFVTPA
jgi:hypothetical protein